MAVVETTRVGDGRYRTVAAARGLRSRAYATTPGRAHTMARIRLARALRLARSVWPSAPVYTAPEVRESPALREARAELALLQRHRAEFTAQLARHADDWQAPLLRGAVDALSHAIEAAGRNIERMGGQS